MIIPAILVNTFEEFTAHIKRVENLFDLAQIDVMDGEFVPNKSFSEIDEINNLKTNIKFELHLMVTHPLAELQKWKNIKNISRVIFHIESKDNPEEVINYCRGKCWQVGIAINPETGLETIKPYLNLIDEVLFLTVHPGKQGALFLPEVGQKIKEFAKIKTRLLCAVDGGIKMHNIKEVASWGVDVFCVGSSLIMADDVKKTKEELMNEISL